MISHQVNRKTNKFLFSLDSFSSDQSSNFSHLFPSFIREEITWNYLGFFEFESKSTASSQLRLKEKISLKKDGNSWINEITF